MKILEIMERAGINETGRALAYIKDGLEEMNLISETHVMTQRMSIAQDQRFYNFPNNMIKLLDIRCKDHDNDNGEYRSIPRMIYEPSTEDSDGN
tara:strand:- start:1 stop:282 length:282 start_codon:yes stop_codon:yes gene_type:complete